jgi:hypothetical protein
MKRFSLLSLLLLVGIVVNGCGLQQKEGLTIVPSTEVDTTLSAEAIKEVRPANVPVPTSSPDQMKEELEQPPKPTIIKEKPRSNRTENSEIKAIERKGVSISRLVRPDEAINELRQSSRFEAPPRFILDTGTHNRVSMYSQPSSESKIIAEISDRREVQIIRSEHVNDYYRFYVTKEGKSITGYIKIGKSSADLDENSSPGQPAADRAQLRRIVSGSDIQISQNGDDSMWRDDDTGTHTYRIETQTKEKSKIYKSPNSNSDIITEIGDGARISINKNISPINGFYALELGRENLVSGWIKIDLKHS